jgi:amino acid permease
MRITATTAATLSLLMASAAAAPIVRRPFPTLAVRGGAAAVKKTATAAPTTPLVRPAKKPDTTTTTGGTATIPTEVFNLVKAILGVGVLSLPAGVAAFGNSAAAAPPAVALIAVMGLLSANGFSTMGRVCCYTGATSYTDAWSRTVGTKTRWIPAASTTLKTSMACLAYSMVLADTVCSIAGSTQRTPMLLALTGVVLLPLCWLKDLASLAPFSLLGVVGMAGTGLAMTKRYWDGSYQVNAATSSSSSSSLLQSVSANLQPKFGTDTWKSVLHPNSLILVCMLSTAYMAHFNAPKVGSVAFARFIFAVLLLPFSHSHKHTHFFCLYTHTKFYNELQNNTMTRFNTVVAISFLFSIIIMAGITASGFLTFGSACSGLVLNNYSPKDVLMGASRVAVAISLVFSYPLAFQGCRDGLLDLFQVPDAQRRKNSFLNLVTVGLLSVITLMAATLTDVSFVLAFGGGTK